MKIGTKVKVISGSDKGKQGLILSKKDSHITVKGIKMVSFVLKEQDGSKKISKKESPIHISNVVAIS